MSLIKEARKRREKLKALRERKEKIEEGEEDSEGKKLKLAEYGQPVLPRPVFRSYQPTDEKLKEGILEPAKSLDVKDHVKEELKAAKEKTVIEEVDLINLAPRKPDWDLKRDILKNLEKLERRTQKAIAELIRDRLQSIQMKTEEIAASVSLKNNSLN